jgi:hypothetical protein
VHKYLSASAREQRKKCLSRCRDGLHSVRAEARGFTSGGVIKESAGLAEQRPSGGSRAVVGTSGSRPDTLGGGRAVVGPGDRWAAVRAAERW